jgi:C4-dicarboxylate transporter, DctM subunit
MSVLLVASIGLVAVILFTLIGIPIAYAIGFCSVVCSTILFGQLGLSKLGGIAYSEFFGQSWSTLPLFVLLASLINSAGIATNVFRAASNWVSRLPGGVVISAVIAEAVMGAAIGNSTLTLLSVGKVAVPQAERLGYNKMFCAAAITAGGVLGPLIPPSIPLIVYGIMAQQSIARLFIAGIVPGIILMFLLCLYVLFVVMRNPKLAPRKAGVSWRERFASALNIWPIVLILILTIGGLYMGVVTASEAAGLAVFVTLIVAYFFFHFRFVGLLQALKEAATTSGMILLMIIAVKMFTYMVGTSGLAEYLAKAITSGNLSPWIIMIIINLILLILGCFVDSLALMLITLPFFLPIVHGLGFDLIWFGIVICVNIEIGLLTPPIGLNMFIAKAIFDLPLGGFIRALIPFIGVLILFLGIIVALPVLSTWLPGMMFGN